MVGLGGGYMAGVHYFNLQPQLLHLPQHSFQYTAFNLGPLYGYHSVCSWTISLAGYTLARMRALLALRPGPTTSFICSF